MNTFEIMLLLASLAVGTAGAIVLRHALLIRSKLR